LIVGVHDEPFARALVVCEGGEGVTWSSTRWA
jgi:hypothetical protein